ncbi:MAG: hypothetical protein ACTJLL_04290 [Anaplasma sp.]
MARLRFCCNQSHTFFHAVLRHIATLAAGINPGLYVTSVAGRVLGSVDGSCSASVARSGLPEAMVTRLMDVY